MEPELTSGELDEVYGVKILLENRIRMLVFDASRHMSEWQRDRLLELMAEDFRFQS